MTDTPRDRVEALRAALALAETDERTERSKLREHRCALDQVLKQKRSITAELTRLTGSGVGGPAVPHERAAYVERCTTYLGDGAAGKDPDETIAAAHVRHFDNLLVRNDMPYTYWWYARVPGRAVGVSLPSGKSFHKMEVVPVLDVLKWPGVFTLDTPYIDVSFG